MSHGMNVQVTVSKDTSQWWLGSSAREATKGEHVHYKIGNSPYNGQVIL